MPVACATWLGLLIGPGHGAGVVVAALILALACGWLAQRAPSRVGTLALLAALLAAGMARGAAHRLLLVRERAAFGDPARPLRIEARVVAPPARASGEPSASVRIERADPAMIAGTRATLRLPAGSVAEWGDRITVLARLEPPPPARNPGGFDARAFADADGSAAGGFAYTCVVEPPRGLSGWPRATAARWRRAIESRLQSGLLPAAREIAIPLVTGDRSALSSDLSAAFRASGLVHLLALSGLHVVWLAALARGACGALGGGVTARALAAAACAIGYAALAGPLPSLLRASATETCAALARLSGRALAPAQALALSAVALLVVAPGWAGDVGFQLSCAATLGLVTLGPALDRAAGRARRLTAAFAPTVAAQIVALPILLLRFHALSWTGMLANLVAVPVSGLLLTAAWLGAGLDALLPGTGTVFLRATDVLALALRGIASVAGGSAGDLPAAGHEPALAACAGVAATLLAIGLRIPATLEEERKPWSRPRVAAVLAGGIALVLTLALLASVRPLRPPPGRYWMVALDVGQGDAIALGFADGWWMVDTGPRTPRYDAGERVLLPFLRWAGVRRLRAAALTHDDRDHTGGAPALVRGIPIGRWWAPPDIPGVRSPGRRVAASRAARGDTLHRAPWVVVRWPPRPGEDRSFDPSASLTTPDNDAGLVLEVGEGAGRVLLLADVDSTVEARLAIDPGLAVLKVAHHGSGSSTGSGLLARARPRLAVISVGVRNSFGHPAPGVLARLRAAGVPIARTDAAGAVWIELGEEGPRRVEWSDGCQLRDRSAAEGIRLPVPKPHW